MQLLDGKSLSIKLLAELSLKVKKLPVAPILDLILVGEDAPSLKYCEMKQKMGKSIGINGTLHHLAKANTEEIIDLVGKLNISEKVTAFMIQLPLPKNLDTYKIINSINPAKDADGLTAVNLGRLFHRQENAIISATPLGIMKLFEEYEINLCGKNAVIIGRSPFIGLPLAAALMNNNATVSLCHSYSLNTKELCQKADIIISSTGKNNFITKDFIKPGAIVVDVGREVDFDNVADKTSFITPPIGGVGPMTVASLLANTVKIAYENSTF